MVINEERPIEEKRDLNYIKETVCNSVKTGDGCQITTEVCNYAEIPSILLAYGWKKTGMKRPKKRIAVEILKQYKNEGMKNYEIFYNVKAPKQLAILGMSDTKIIISILNK